MQEDEWFPIEIAPKDKFILVYDGETMVVGKHIWNEHWAYYAKEEVPGQTIYQTIVPIYWRPLPNPPREC